MKLLTLCLCSIVWAGVSWVCDRSFHDFWIALTLGGLAALCVFCALGACRSAGLAAQYEREQLRRIAEETDKPK